MKVAIHQPHYLPWLGYLAKWAEADVFVFLDTVQFEKNGWQNRNRIKTAAGPQWLTVPVRARLGTAIADVAIDTAQPWARRHLRAIELAYRRAAGWAGYGEDLRAFYSRPWGELAALAVANACWLASALGIATPSRLASELTVTATDPTERLVEICRAVGGTTYLAGRDGVQYMDLKRFRHAGLEVRAQAYEPPIYPQLHGPFVPALSGLDLLLSNPLSALAILRRGDTWVPLGP